MRKMLSGCAAAAVVAAVIALFTSSLYAANAKPCYAHSENLAGTNFSAVWSTGGGHGSHANDVFLGSFLTAAECQAAFDTWEASV